MSRCARTWLVLATLSAGPLGCAPPADEEPAPSPRRTGPLRLTVEVVRRLPHDPEAFTQGLVWHRGALYESLGGYGLSAVRRVELASGAVLRETRLPDDRFGEGLERVGERLVQLTWRAGEARVYDLETLELERVLSYRGEGWGLCLDGERLVRSDGSDRLTFHEPASLGELGQVAVHLSGRPLRNLNELECAEGFVYANVWQTDQIVRIDPATGAVEAVIDASGLMPAGDRPGVLNGIAYDAEGRTFYLTGKNWPLVFEVTFVAAR